MCYQTPWRCPRLSGNRGSQPPRPVELCQFGSWRQVESPGHPWRKHGDGSCHQSQCRWGRRAWEGWLHWNTTHTRHLGGGKAGMQEGRMLQHRAEFIPAAEYAWEMVLLVQRKSHCQMYLGCGFLGPPSELQLHMCDRRVRETLLKRGNPKKQ